LAQQATEAKSNEITAIPKVRPPDLRDYVLTSVFAKRPLGAIDFR
jgi:hypothetical protein